MGGWSIEREISLQSGKTVVSALQNLGIPTTTLDLKADNMDTLLTRILDCDRIFNIVHGKGGEDGCIQGFLDALGIPYTGSGLQGSCSSMDKLLSKELWEAGGLSTPNGIRLESEASCTEKVFLLDFPVIVKPIFGGSSIGTNKANTTKELVEAWKQAKRFTDDIMAEKWIDGKEYFVGFIRKTWLPPILLIPPKGHEFYDYAAKYEAHATQYICPCGLDNKQIADMQRLAAKACSLLHVEGWGRLDIVRDESGRNSLLEANSIPGLTSHSLIPKAALTLGLEVEKVVLEILASSFNIRRTARNSRI